jgi:hypothetical protein
MASFFLCYHKQTKIACDVRRWDTFSDAEHAGDFEVVQLDTDNYNAETRKWTLTLDGVQKDVALSKIVDRLDSLLDIDVSGVQSVTDAIAQAKEDFAHDKIVGIQ